MIPTPILRIVFAAAALIGQMQRSSNDVAFGAIAECAWLQARQMMQMMPTHETWWHQ